eukprot:scaffold70355_cov65-Attheya_sp.AAC.2
MVCADQVSKRSSFFKNLEEAVSDFVVSLRFADAFACEEVVAVYVQWLATFTWRGIRGEEESENGGERDFTGKVLIWVVFFEKVRNGRVDVSQFAYVERIEAGSLTQRSLVKRMPEVA